MGMERLGVCVIFYVKGADRRRCEKGEAFAPRMGQSASHQFGLIQNCVDGLSADDKSLVLRTTLRALTRDSAAPRGRGSHMKLQRDISLCGEVRSIAGCKHVAGPMQRASSRQREQHCMRETISRVHLHCRHRQKQKETSQKNNPILASDPLGRVLQRSKVRTHSFHWFITSRYYRFAFAKLEI